MKLRDDLLRSELMALCVGVLLGFSALISVTAGAQASLVIPQNVGCHSTIAKVGRKLGPTYVEKLSVSGISCQAGTGLITADNRCRIKSGGLSGHCRTRVDGFSCSETREGSSDQFIAAVICRKPREAVDFTYSENT